MYGELWHFKMITDYGLMPIAMIRTHERTGHHAPCCVVDQDKNDQGTTDILEPARFLVSDQFCGRNMFDFLF